MVTGHPVHDAYAEALAAGGGTVPLGDTVLCDNCSLDLTADPRTGGFLFGTYAIGPCCAGAYRATVEGYGEERYIRGECPAAVSFADWVRALRGPGAAITVMPLWHQPGDRR